MASDFSPKQICFKVSNTTSKNECYYNNVTKVGNKNSYMKYYKRKCERHLTKLTELVKTDYTVLCNSSAPL